MLSFGIWKASVSMANVVIKGVGGRPTPTIAPTIVTITLLFVWGIIPSKYISMIILGVA